jgi:hypothetical protein
MHQVCRGGLARTKVRRMKEIQAVAGALTAAVEKNGKCWPPNDLLDTASLETAVRPPRGPRLDVLKLSCNCAV